MTTRHITTAGAIGVQPIRGGGYMLTLMRTRAEAYVSEAELRSLAEIVSNLLDPSKSEEVTL